MTLASWPPGEADTRLELDRLVTQSCFAQHCLDVENDLGRGADAKRRGGAKPLTGESTGRPAGPDRGGGSPLPRWGLDSAPSGGQTQGEGRRPRAKPWGMPGWERRPKATRGGGCVAAGGAGGGAAPKRRRLFVALPKRSYPQGGY